jgi:hypothetical protein
VYLLSCQSATIGEGSAKDTIFLNW